MSFIVAADLRMGLLWTQDHKVYMTVSPDHLRKRLPNGLGFAFFHAALSKEGILELGDPAPFSKGWPIVRPSRTMASEPVERPADVFNPRDEARVPTVNCCPCGARQHKGLCNIAIENERREARALLEAEVSPPSSTIAAEVVT